MRPRIASARAGGRQTKFLYGGVPKGHKRVYLPNHVITFVRPKPWQPPTLATFVVPLKFNKLDMRDYLFHAYQTRVRNVRAFIRAFRLSRREDGKKFRPRPEKMMTCELEKPFVWPDPPPKPFIGSWPGAKPRRQRAKKEEEGDREEKNEEGEPEMEGGARSPWDYAIWKRAMMAREKRHNEHPYTLKAKKPPLRKTRSDNAEWGNLRKQAAALLQGTIRWSERAPATGQKGNQ